jgi:hypothetical protein
MAELLSVIMATEEHAWRRWSAAQCARVQTRPQAGGVIQVWRSPLRVPARSTNTQSRKFSKGDTLSESAGPLLIGRAESENLLEKRYIWVEVALAKIGAPPIFGVSIASRY